VTKNPANSQNEREQSPCNRIVQAPQEPDCLGAAESLSDTFVGAGWRDIPFQVQPFLIGM
jgi:hypothetical protein